MQTAPLHVKNAMIQMAVDFTKQAEALSGMAKG
jgi:hypothetical protein